MFGRAFRRGRETRAEQTSTRDEQDPCWTAAIQTTGTVRLTVASRFDSCRDRAYHLAAIKAGSTVGRCYQGF